MGTLFVSAFPEVSLCECVFARTLVFRLITTSKMKTGLIAFHLAYFQLLSVPVMEAVVFQNQLDVLQTLSNVVYTGALGAENAAGT